MQGVRELADRLYDRYRDTIFARTAHNPELAHEHAVKLGRIVDKLHLSRFLLDNDANSYGAVRFANAAGSNKNADIPPRVLKYFGFDVNIIGTVTYDSWGGNPLSTEMPTRIWRFPPGSLVNWLGLPGVGAQKVAQRMNEYGPRIMRTRASIMSTPGKSGQNQIDDIVNSIQTVDSCVDEYELNISCPNTEHAAVPHDARDAYKRTLNLIVGHAVNATTKPIYVKLSPDMTEEEVGDTLAVCSLSDFSTLGIDIHALPVIPGTPVHKGIVGFTVSNTTTERVTNKIPAEQKNGGASGDAVYKRAAQVQSWIEAEIERNYKTSSWTINAVGGISSVTRFLERTANPRVKEVQLYTPLIYKPSLIRTLRMAV
jgi:dihydroorotate dehydrogenase